MTGYLSVKNFERFQHYKDRAPPWIKFHASTLDDYEFAQLPDASKGHLLSIWLLASKLDNRIPNDAKWIARRINATERVDIELLVRAGFLSEQDASGTLATRTQDACLETEERERREETETEGEAEGARPKRAPNATRIPDDWKPSEELKAWAAENEPVVDAGRETLKFLDYWRAASGAKARKSDWDATWRGWIRRAAERPPPNGHSGFTSEAERIARKYDQGKPA